MTFSQLLWPSELEGNIVKEELWTLEINDNNDNELE